MFFRNIFLTNTKYRLQDNENTEYFFYYFLYGISRWVTTWHYFSSWANQIYKANRNPIHNSHSHSHWYRRRLSLNQKRTTVVPPPPLPPWRERDGDRERDRDRVRARICHIIRLLSITEYRLRYMNLYIYMWCCDIWL